MRASASSPTTSQPTARDAATRGRFLLWAALYAVAVVYVSLVLGPVGLNFVPRDLSVAWRMLLDAPYLPIGAAQRPDWVANLLMAVPLGFLTAGAVWPWRRRRQALRRQAWRWQAWRCGLAITAAIIACWVFVVAVKYAQLFFPPRTVSLNYILAQLAGSTLGVILFPATRPRLSIWHRQFSEGGQHALVVVGKLYTVLLFFFFLFPFDFALSGADLHQRLRQVPQLLLSWQTARPPGLGLVLLLGGTARPYRSA
ncbi:MAG TPA: VanZ family protein [Stellaceae bacterium]|nr:VanZ family protein [Stellaceae bacterium]